MRLFKILINKLILADALIFFYDLEDAGGSSSGVKPGISILRLSDCSILERTTDRPFPKFGENRPRETLRETFPLCPRKGRKSL